MWKNIIINSTFAILLCSCITQIEKCTYANNNINLSISNADAEYYTGTNCYTHPLWGFAILPYVEPGAGNPLLGLGCFMKAAFSFCASTPLTFPSFVGESAPDTSEAKGSSLPSLTLGRYSTVLGGGSEGGEAVLDCGVLEPTAYGGELKSLVYKLLVERLEPPVTDMLVLPGERGFGCCAIGERAFGLW